MDDGADRFERKDFALGELDSAAPWVSQAKEAHAKRASNLAKVEELAGLNGATVVNGDDVDMAGDALVGGGSEELFSWDQTKEDVIVTVKCPLETKGKDVACKIAKQKLYLDVATVEKPADKQGPIIDGELFQECVADESAWTLETESGYKNVVVTLTKGVSVEGKPMRWLMLTR